MRLDVVGSDDRQVDLLPPRMEAESADSAGGVWMRCCPQCKAVLWKTTPRATVHCGCGWEWH